MRDQLARASLLSADRMEQLAGQAQEGMGRDAARDFQRTTGHSVQELHAMASSLRQDAQAYRHASCWWISEQMTHLALDASSDLPDWTPLAVMPDHSGILIWHEGLPPIPWPSAPDKVWTVTALGQRTPPLVIPHGAVWSLRPADGLLQIDILTRTAMLARGSLAASWRDTPLFSVVSVLMPPDLPASPATDQLWTAGLVHCLGATWLLSQQPTVAQQHPVELDRADGRALRRSGVPTDVRVVDLRRTANPTDDSEPEPSGRHLTHRHLVRGHWRQQACGPARSQRRPTWIAPYIQGPDSAPLSEREQVMVWRR